MSYVPWRGRRCAWFRIDVCRFDPGQVCAYCRDTFLEVVGSAFSLAEMSEEERSKIFESIERQCLERCPLWAMARRRGLLSKLFGW